MAFLLCFFSISSEYFLSIISDPRQSLGRFLNTTLTLRSLSLESDLVTPFSISNDTFPLKNSSRSFHDLVFRPDVAYHSSAILATTFECMTLPWRLKNARARHSMSDVASGLAERGRKLASAACAMPFPGGRFRDSSLAELMPDVSPDDTLGLVSLTPCVDFIKNETSMMALAARGLESRLKPAGFNLSDPHWQKEYSRNIYLRSDSVNQAFLCHFSQHWPDTRVGVTSAEDGASISSPYPKIFAQQDGDTSKPVLTAWSSSTGLGGMLRKMSGRLAKINLGKLHRFGEAGLESDDIEAILEDLDSLAKAYEPDALV